MFPSSYRHLGTAKSALTPWEATAVNELGAYLKAQLNRGINHLDVFAVVGLHVSEPLLHPRALSTRW